MVGETFFEIYYWAIYVWFVAGALLIGVPAIIQLAKFLVKKQ
jgi:hypothetical protein